MTRLATQIATTIALLNIGAAVAASEAAAAPAEAPAFRTERVTFRSEGETLVGTLYIPAGVSSAHPAPGVVVTGAWMTVKEQMAGRYAAELARRGLVALAFDFRTWGESGGAQRSMESAPVKIADIQAAARALDARPETVDGAIGGLGICASAGYMAHAAADSPILRSVALVAPWLHDAAIVDQVYGADNVASLKAAGRAAEDRFQATGSLTLVPAAGPAGSGAIMAGPSYYTDPARGAVPAWENTFNVASWGPWLSFDALAAAPRLQAPLLVVHSQAAAIPHGAERFFRTSASTAKTEVWVDGVTQMDFYDQPAPVATAADAAAAHFRFSLLPSPAGRPLAPVGAPETARVVQLVSSIPLAVDLEDFAGAERAFAPSVVVDYTSLWGGEAAVLTPAALIDGWRSIVPGFDATFHELSEVRASVDGDTAIATAQVDGRHWLDGECWRPIGHYHWDLARDARGRWTVTRMVFAVTEEHGDRSLAARARERAAARIAAGEPPTVR